MSKKLNYILGGISAIITIGSAVGTISAHRKVKELEGKSLDNSKKISKLTNEFKDFEECFANLEVDLKKINLFTGEILECYKEIDSNMTSIKEVTDNLDWLDGYNAKTIQGNFKQLELNNDHLQKQLTRVKDILYRTLNIEVEAEELTPKLSINTEEISSRAKK